MTTRSSSSGWIGMSIVTLAMVSVLLALGFWQLGRKDEKRTLIAALTQRLAADAVALPNVSEWRTLTPARDEFRRVTFAATAIDKPDVTVFSSGSALRGDITGVGGFVFAPVQSSAGGPAIVIDRGFVAEGQQAKATALEPKQQIMLTGYIRFPEESGVLTPRADQAKRLWFARDHVSMASALGWGDVAPFYIDLETPSPANGLPKPGPLAVHLKDNHLQYAMTWFGLAAVVSIAFGFWLAQRRKAAE